PTAELPPSPPSARHRDAASIRLPLPRPPFAVIRGLDKRVRALHPGRKNARPADEEVPLATPVVMIPGDGIGPEVMAATRRVVQAAGADLAWVEAAAGLGAAEALGDPLPADTLDRIRKHRVAL